MRERSRAAFCSFAFVLLAGAGCRTPATGSVSPKPAGVVPVERVSDISERSLAYSVRPIPRSDRVDLEITLRFVGSATGETVLELPRDRYGTPNLHESVTSVESTTGTVVAGASAQQRLIRHPPSALVEATYTISWEPARSSGYAYSPSVSAAHFHFMGPQWIAWPEGYDQTLDLHVSFAGLPDGWSVLSSFGLGGGPHLMKGVVLGDVASFIAGGAYRIHDFACAERPVRVGVTGEFTLPDRTIFENTERIVCAERRWMNDHEQPFYTVSVTPREGIRAGTAISNAFIALVDPEITERRLNTLLAHEMFHYWLPGRGRVVGADFDEEVWASKWGYQWIDEGFPEYFARTILHETGLLTRDDLVELTNEDIADYWQNEHREIPYLELRRAAEENRFMSTHQRIGYYRGTLLALDWDTRIRAAPAGRESLSDAIREIVATAETRGGHLPEGELHRIMARFGIDSADAFARVIVRGEAPPVNPGAYLPDYVLGERILYDFAPGFDVAASRREKIVRGVVPGGHAHEAGLRDGMELVRMENSLYYDPKAPLKVTVRMNGSERTIEFFPKGDPMRVPVYEPAKM